MSFFVFNDELKKSSLQFPHGWDIIGYIRPVAAPYLLSEEWFTIFTKRLQKTGFHQLNTNTVLKIPSQPIQRQRQELGSN